MRFLSVLSLIPAITAAAQAPGPDPDTARFEIVETAVNVSADAAVCTVMARDRSNTSRLPALLQFTIYADSLQARREAVRSAAKGYVGVMGFSRGKACGSGTIEPYTHDGADAATLIEWLGAHPWIDGRVGMYGGSYSGFTAWAAAGHRPEPLKAIMVGAPVAPGIDVPMEGNIFLSFVYPWPLWTMNGKWLDDATYSQNARWNRVYREWYAGGKPYRELEQIDGTPNPGFAAWLAHPEVDGYWKRTIPDGPRFRDITIPVLQTYGYFFGGPGGALHYYHEHTRHNPRANHYLLIGPYDHPQAQRGVVSARGDTVRSIAGLATDPAAHIDIVASVRYQWFDHWLKGAPMPALLKVKVNYQLMGANVWRSAPSVATAMSGRLRIALTPAPVTLTVNLADRGDIDRPLVGGLQADVIDTAGALVFRGEPLHSATEVFGPLSGRLALVTNKRDFDFVVTPYELRADGQYFQLAPFMSRASHVQSLTDRRLLTPGKVERLDFASRLRVTGRRLTKGSRVVVVIAVVKNSGMQINYGTGNDVNGESIADAGEPLSIRLLPGSYVELPIRR
jgi:predicted acyl esterase